MSIVPTLCVGMPPGTLRVPLLDVTQSVTGCIPTQSVGTISHDQPAERGFTCGNDSAPRPLHGGRSGRNGWRCHSQPPGRYR
ncbi:hypothetical protein F7R20_12075 [Pseudomonas brassicacearum subsp. brassicacearum]|nr:hypothetical protein F7R20_12075 [Pseudomonas brassicacearum subsp. brassicacearum]